MENLLRLYKAEFLKMKHTMFLPVHFLFPSIGTVVLILCSSFCKWSEELAVQSFIQILSILFPLLGAFMISWNLDYEEKAGNFQTLLVQSQGRITVLITKALYLYGLGILACFWAFFVFYIANARSIKIDLFLKIFAAICLCQLVEYIIHIFLRLKFGTGITIGFGILEFLISALMLTGLGDGRWQLFPCSWASRISGYLVMEFPWKGVSMVLFISLAVIILFLLFIRKFEVNKSSMG